MIDAAGLPFARGESDSMAGKLHIWPEEQVTEHGCVTVAAILQLLEGRRGDPVV